MIVADGSGELRKIFTGTGSFTFPIGDNTGSAEYSPVTLNFTSGAFAGGAYAGARVTNAKDPNNTSSTDYLVRYWTMSSSGISGFSYNATYQYVPADVVGTEGNIYCGSWDGSIWALHGTANPATHQLPVNALTSFSRFTGGQQSALPVQLANFNAVAAGQSRVRLNWSTVSETNNYGFEVQKSARSAEGYETIANSFVPGHGTTLKPEQYSYVDETAQPGMWYYRLKQIDLDGTAHYTDGVQVSMVMGVKETAPVEFALNQNYPNPFNPETQIKFAVEQSGRTTLRVYNSLGQEVATLFDDVAEAGQYYTVKLNGMGLASGVYFYKLESGSKSDLKKMSLLK